MARRFVNADISGCCWVACKSIMFSSDMTIIGIPRFPPNCGCCTFESVLQASRVRSSSLCNTRQLYHSTAMAPSMRRRMTPSNIIIPMRPILRSSRPRSSTIDVSSSLQNWMLERGGTARTEVLKRIPGEAKVSLISFLSSLNGMAILGLGYYMLGKSHG